MLFCNAVVDVVSIPNRPIVNPTNVPKIPSPVNIPAIPEKKDTDKEPENAGTLK